MKLLLGLWLVSGQQQRLARAAAIVTFAAFFTVSLYRAFSGAESCGCFGRLQVDPWITSSFNLALVFALLIVRPSSGSSSSTTAVWQPLRMHTAMLMSLAAAVYLGIVTAVPASGGLHVANRDHDFGVLEADRANINHTFVLTNRTDHPITIRSIQTSCGCTVATPNQQTVLPGATLEVPTRVNWARRTGVQREQVLIVTDSSAAPRVTLTVRGTVNNSDDEADIDGIQVSPGSLVFDGPTSRSLTVTLGQHYAGTVPDVTVCEGSSHFIVRDVRRNADGRQAIIDIEFDAVAGDGEPVHRAELCVTVGSDSVVVPMIAVARVAQWPSSVPLP